MRLILIGLLTLLHLSRGEDLESLATASIRKNCLACHNTSSRMGGLVLESRESALKGGAGGPAIQPGNAAASLLAEKVRTGQMPAGNPLPAAERELLARWIAAGAPWSGRLEPRKRAGKDWWSLQPVQQVAGTIDSLLAVELARKGLKPSPTADRRTLIRRATFDLTGLPPAPEDVEAFVGDPMPDAYPRLVDRLLASPAYGERWGRHWLDVIRFGESHGYEQNHLRPNAWPFRDYVIRSFNDDKPFDRMVLEHLAGDRLAPGDPAVEVATGFLVAGPHDTVGNQSEAARRQQRADDLDDMVNATASAFLGLTVSCARCHDHKFDPILQADYYRMAATFAGVVHVDGELATTVQKRSVEERRKPLRAALDDAVARLKLLRDAAKPQVETQRLAILGRYRPAVSSMLTEESFTSTPARFVRLTIRASSNKGPAGLEEIEIWSESRNVALHAKATASSTRVAEDNASAYSASLLTDGRFDQRWFAADNKPVELTIELPRQFEIGRVSWSRDRTGSFQERFSGPVPSDYTLAVSTDGLSYRQVASSEGRLPATEAEREEMLLLAVLSRDERMRWESLSRQQKEAQQKIAALPKLPVAYIGKFEEPKEPVYLLKRGSVMDRGDVIASGALSTLGFGYDPVESEGARRLAFARWIVDARNPLTPRVLANRIWQNHFGTGIVATPSDFGYNGERPANPQLLDYLAQRLLAYGWRMKPLHREIMLSKAYQQSSSFREENAKIDSESRYLWRFPPQRLHAEAIRDSILAVSGALDRRMGGPGFHLYRYTVDNVATYYPIEKFGPDTYRRAVYQQAARSVRSEMLGQYDCPDSSLPEPRRIVTTSPLQALSLLNNTFLVDQSRLFAERLKRESADGRTQVSQAFQLAFGRAAEPAEMEAALHLIASHGLFAFCRALFNSNEFIYVM